MSQLTQREREVLTLIRADPLTSQQEIADALGISRSAVAGYVMKLTTKGAIRGRGYVLNDAPFVVCIGGANIDITGRPSAALRRRDSNPGAVRTSPGGVARNIAENLARLDVSTRLISAVGADHFGDLLLSQGREAGVDMRHVVRLPHMTTSTYLSVLEESGDMLMAVSDMEICERLDAAMLEKQERVLQAAAAIVIDTNLTDDALAYLAARCAERPIFADTVSTAKAGRLEPYLSAVHSIFPSRLEAETLTGRRGRHRRELKAQAEWFHVRGVQQVFITMGKDGVFFSDGSHQDILAPVSANRTVNANGAGDAFAAGIIRAWLAQKPLRDCAEFATAAADHTLRDAATVSPSLSVRAVNRIRETHYVH